MKEKVNERKKKKTRNPAPLRQAKLRLAAGPLSGAPPFPIKGSLHTNFPSLTGKIPVSLLQFLSE